MLAYKLGWVDNENILAYNLGWVVNDNILAYKLGWVDNDNIFAYKLGWVNVISICSGLCYTILIICLILWIAIHRSYHFP